MRIAVADPSLVLVVGASGSGKSTFAARHFRATEVLSSDAFRGMVADDSSDQAATPDAFDALRYVAAKRLAAGRLTVIDATNVRREDRKFLLDLARDHDVLAAAIVLDLPEKVCVERNRARPDREFGPRVVEGQARQLRRSLRGLSREGFHRVTVLRSLEEVEAAVVERSPLWNDRRDERGPFDVIGDVHGCLEELDELLARLGWARDEAGVHRHPAGRKAVFLGDLVDRGPDSPGVLERAMAMVEAGTALAIPGNHEARLLKKLRGKDVLLTHGLPETLEQLAVRPPEFVERVKGFLDGLISHYVLDGGALVVAHAGLKEAYQGRASGRVRQFAMYGETTGETDEFGLPVRFDWAAEYRGRARVVYGHVPVPEAEWFNRTIDVDTGCVFGGKLTALRWPELELVSVPARRTYAEPIRPMAAPEGRSAQQAHDDLLDLADVTGKRVVSTRIGRQVVVREDEAAAAVEAVSRFAIDPRWLVYLPPTMSPVATSSREGFLERPEEAFAYYAQHRVRRVVCEEKHMGSRAIVVVARDEAAARDRFGATDGSIGALYTRTGRPFFDDAALERAILERVAAALAAAGLWDRFETTWFVLDAELLPWSAKAEMLIRSQYAAVAAAARASLPGAITLLERARARGVDTGGVLDDLVARRDAAQAYERAYRRYEWPVGSIDDLRLAPFHVLASEGRVHIDLDHARHMETLAAVAAADPALLLATAHRVVDLEDPGSVEAATAWWAELTEAGGEGLVVKPNDFVARGKGGLVQPAVKCRGREYLRIIYGPDYDLPGNLERLRHRGLGFKRSLALKEFALGLEALQRFVEREPLRRVHECVVAILALESEPVDPRL